MQSFKQAISLDPRHVSSYKELGQVYLKQREYEKAMVLYRRAISVKPDVFELHMGLSHSLANLNLEDEALAALNRGILADPSGADAFHRKLVQTDPAKWLETFKKGSETGPEALEAYNNLGVAYLYLKRYAEAMDIFERLILLDPRHASAYNNLGKAHYEQGDNERAINNFKRAIEIAPEVPLPYINLARVYIDAQRYEDAIKTCQRALVVRSDYAKTYYTLGLAHLAAGDRTSAIHDHRVLLTLNRDLARKLYEAINK